MGLESGSDLALDLEKYHLTLSNVHVTRDTGKVTEVTGLVIKGYLPGAAIGSTVEIRATGRDEVFSAEAVGFEDKTVVMMPYGNVRGVGLGARILLSRSVATVKVSEQLLGRVIDGLGQPIDKKPKIESAREVRLYGEVRNPLARRPITQLLDLGVRSLNGLVTVGCGQRIGILAGSGVGKSVLIGMISRYTQADVNVIALVGERGRELREFLEKDLGSEGLKKSVVVVATSDQSPLLRMRAAYVATAISEYFSAQGKNVLLMMDSITRFAMAQREIGLSVGEPPATKGYTPSVFSTLPKILERAGSFEGEGSITGLYTVLVEGDDLDDPIGDSVRSIVDGHVILSRSLAQRGHFPAVDILQSSSRVMRSVIGSDHADLAIKAREMLAIYKDAEDLINIGAYKPGANPKIDKAIRVNESLTKFLRQAVEEPSSMEETLSRLKSTMAQV